MGTTWQLSLGQPLDTRARDALRRSLQRRLDSLTCVLSTYAPASELSRFNRAPAARWHTLSATLAAALASSFAVTRASEGAFDITVGPLVELWGFGQRPAEPHLPSPADLHAARRKVGRTHLEVRAEPRAWRKDVDGVEVDLSAIGEGIALDHLARVLARHGVRHYLLELGGELRAAGRKADGGPWRVGIESPGVAGPAVERVIELDERAISSSGTYRTRLAADGQAWSHIIDPRSGRPVDHAVLAVSVVHASAALADAWATALLVLGPTEGTRVAEREALAAVFITATATGFEVHETSVFRREVRSEPRELAWSATFE
jgi:thiamine biosynthesis lipoprotein